VTSEPERAGEQQQTLDEELLTWLGDEPQKVRAADTGRVRDIAEEFAAGFQALAGVGPAVTVFDDSVRYEDRDIEAMFERLVGD
jgi:hypothetical protein